MELDDLISELQMILDVADVTLKAGSGEGAREQLRRAKDLLDDEFVND